MSDHKKRIQTLNTLIAGSIISNHPHDYTTVMGEFNLVHRSQSIKENNRRWLVEILHATRALDTALQRFLIEKSWDQKHGGGQARTLGEYLVELERNGPFRSHLAQGYQTSIVDERNRYMHKAGAFPRNVNEVRTLLSEMESLLVEILAEN